VKQPSELETRVSNRKRELISEIIEHMKNSSRAGAAEAIDRIKLRLSDLAYIEKQDMVDGWTNVGPRAKLALDEWMTR
jgi:hypothetical protein